MSLAATTCMSTSDISQLNSHVLRWKTSNQPEDSELYQKFCSIYEITENTGRLSIPETFKPKVARWMGNCPGALDLVATQDTVWIRNKVMEEDAVFNSLRQKRPVLQSQAAEHDLIEQLVNNSKENCDFCSGNELTSEDVPFGRIETQHAYTAANSFKVDAWNSLIIFRGHDPLNWTQAEFIDATFNAATQWFKAVHLCNKSYRYPFIIWDLMPKGGASQIHPHLHVMMTTEKYHGGLEWWKQRSYRYTEFHRKNYFDVDAEIHEALGLAVRRGSAVAMASLTPKKDNEVVVVCPRNEVEFYRLLYDVTRTFIDDMQRTSFSLAVALPPLDESDREIDKATPVFARIITRSAATSLYSDVGALDLFAAPSAATDPFVTARRIKEHITPEKRD